MGPPSVPATQPRTNAYAGVHTPPARPCGEPTNEPVGCLLLRSARKVLTSSGERVTIFDYSGEEIHQIGPIRHRGRGGSCFRLVSRGVFFVFLARPGARRILREGVGAGLWYRFRAVLSAKCVDLHRVF